MARQFLTNVDLAKNELQNARIQNLGSAPGTPVKGQLYMNSTDNILYWYNGTGWVAAQGGAGAVPATTVTTSAVGDSAVVGVATTYSREDHKHAREAFGTITAQTAFAAASTNGSAVTLARSDHAHGTPTHDNAAHSAITLNSLAVPTASVAMNNQRITGLNPTPSSGTEATSKAYVDSLVSGLMWVSPARAATTANITLSAPQTVDGVSVIANDRVLVKNQTLGQDNGIYLVAAGAWTRVTDADTNTDFPSMALFVTSGTLNADTGWTCTTDLPITLGTTPLTFVQFTGAQALVAGTGMTTTGNTVNVIAGTGITVNSDDVALTVPVTVPNGGTGRITSTLAYGVICAGTTATGPLQTIASAGAAGMYLKSAGASATPFFAAISQSEVTNLTTDLGAKTRKFTGLVAATTSTMFAHNFNTRDVVVNVYRNSPTWDTVECDVERPDANNVTVTFATAPAANAYGVVIIG